MIPPLELSRLELFKSLFRADFAIQFDAVLIVLFPSLKVSLNSILPYFRIYSRVQKSTWNFVFRSKMAIFQRAGMKEGGLPLPLTFQYLIFMIWRPSDLNLVMISSLASKCQHFKLRGLQFHSIKWLKNGHPNFKVLAFWSQLRYHDQIQIIRSLYRKNQILKC